MRKGYTKMNKHLKTSIALLSLIFVLAACGQKASSGSATETTQAAQATTTVPTTQAAQATTTAPTTQIASNKQEATEALPKDGEATYKLEKIGGTTILQYFFKDDIVYKQIGIYTYDPKGLGKSDEEVVQFLNKSQDLYEGVTGIKSTVEKKDGKYIQTVTFDYQTIDWRELYKRAPDQYPAKKPKPLKFSEAAAKLLKNGFVKQ